MASKVVVRNIEELKDYCGRLASLKADMEASATKLVTLSDEMKAKATSMHAATEAQSSNWMDPQYERLKGRITPCVTAVNTVSASVKDTATTIKTQMAQVQSSIAYIQQLVRKLNDIS